MDPGRVIQIGMRGSRFDENDIQFGYDVGYTIITMDEYEAMGRAAVIEEIDRFTDAVERVIREGLPG